jgi:NADH-quinone oxidoreductase subunit N
LIVIITAAVVVLGLPYIAREESQPEEYYVLLLLAAAGASAMAASSHFASFYLALEILSVAQYGLVAYVRRDRRGTEAGLKYLILAAASAAFLLFGMALVYAELGTMEFQALANATAIGGNGVVLLGVAMMLASIGFKLSVVPFHLWTSDVYEGAPTPVTAFVATASKAGVLAALVRFYSLTATPIPQSLVLFIACAAAASMIAGNALALIQFNIKRFLAYSSIAHMGYILVAFLAGGESANQAVAVYLIAYSAASLGAFGVIMAVAPHDRREHTMERINDYRGLYWAQPFLGIVLAISMLSLMGIPLTAGFLGKVYVLLAGAQTAHWWLLVLLVLSSVLGVYYYLRIVLLIFAKPDAKDAPLPTVHLTSVARVALLAATVVTILLGVYPAPLLRLVQALIS